MLQSSIIPSLVFSCIALYSEASIHVVLALVGHGGVIAVADDGDRGLSLHKKILRLIETAVS